MTDRFTRPSEEMPALEEMAPRGYWTRDELPTEEQKALAKREIAKIKAKLRGGLITDPAVEAKAEPA